MAVVEKIGVVLERVGQRLQLRETAKEPVTPYEHAERLWGTIAPGRKTDPVESAFFTFHYNETGIRAEGREQNIFAGLTRPYQSLFPELDIFTVSLSMGGKLDDVSFKATIFAPPPSPQFNHNRPYPILVVRELPQQRRGEDPTPYNLLVLVENELYTGRLDKELLGFDSKRGLLVQEFKDWHEEVKGDIEWRRLFTTETLRLFTKIVEPAKETIAHSNREIQAHFREKERAVSWWSRTWGDRLHPGAVRPEDLQLCMTRTGHDFYPTCKLVACLQQV